MLAKEKFIMRRIVVPINKIESYEERKTRRLKELNDLLKSYNVISVEEFNKLLPEEIIYALCSTNKANNEHIECLFRTKEDATKYGDEVFLKNKNIAKDFRQYCIRVMTKDSILCLENVVNRYQKHKYLCVKNCLEIGNREEVISYLASTSDVTEEQFKKFLNSESEDPENELPNIVDRYSYRFSIG